MIVRPKGGWLRDLRYEGPEFICPQREVLSFSSFSGSDQSGMGLLYRGDPQPYAHGQLVSRKHVYVARKGLKIFANKFAVLSFHILYSTWPAKSPVSVSISYN